MQEQAEIIGTGYDKVSGAPVISAELSFAAQRAMNALPPTEREVLVLWNAGMDYREIAERTSQPCEIIGGFLAQARKRLMLAYDLLDVTVLPRPRIDDATVQVGQL